MEPLNIGQAATAAGVSAKMIRHYEGIGLIPKAKRTYSGYRTYSDNEIHVLRFIRHGLWQDRRRASSRVKKLATEHIRELDQKIVQMQAMKATLERLAVHCHGDDRPECPILDELALPDGA